MTSQVGYHGGGSQLYPNQCFVRIKTAGKNVLSGLGDLFQILRSICFHWQLLFLSTMAFMLTHAHGEEQTGVCKLLDPAIICHRWSSVVNFETTCLCPYSPTEKFPVQFMNICIPHDHLRVENHSRVYLKVVVTTVLAIFGGTGFVGLVGWMLYKRWPAFTEANINMGLRSGPNVARRSDSTFEIPPCID